MAGLHALATPSLSATIRSCHLHPGTYHRCAIWPLREFLLRNAKARRAIGPIVAVRRPRQSPPCPPRPSAFLFWPQLGRASSPELLADPASRLRRPHGFFSERRARQGTDTTSADASIPYCAISNPCPATLTLSLISSISPSCASTSPFATLWLLSPPKRGRPLTSVCCLSA